MVCNPIDTGTRNGSAAATDGGAAPGAGATAGARPVTGRPAAAPSNARANAVIDAKRSSRRLDSAQPSTSSSVGGTWGAFCDSGDGAWCTT